MKSKILVIFLTLIVVAAFLFTACAKPAPAPAPAPTPAPTPAPAPAPEVIELRNAEVYQPDHELGMMSQWVADELEKRTNGRVKTKIYFGGTLAVGAETLKGLQEGAFDFSTIIALAYEGQFPLLSLTEGPFDTYSQYAAGKATNEMLRTYTPMIEEQKKNGVILACSHWPSAFAHTTTELKSPSDIEGLKLRSIGSYSGALENAGIRAIGGLPATDVYEAIQRGMVDGAVPYPLSSYALEHFYEVVPYFTDVGMGGYCGGGLGVSRKNFDKLPSDIQDILMKILDEYPVQYQKVSNDKVALYLKMVLDGGGQIKIQSPEDSKVWRAKFQPEKWMDEKIAALEAKGVPAREAYAKWKALTEKYEKGAPPTQAEEILRQLKALGKA